MGLFGIGDGKMDMQIANTTVQSGGAVEGTATLTLNNDVKANGVFAIIYAQRRETSFINGTASQTTVTVYQDKQQLDGPRTYTKGETPKTYNFKLVVPAGSGGAPQQASGGAPQQASGVLGMLQGIAGSMGVMAPLMWYVEVKLDHSLAFDVSKKMQIQVSGP